MKDCPHCGGQIRPSVIRCTHCGTSLVDESQGSGVGTATRGAAASAVGGRPVAATPAVPTAIPATPKVTATPPRTPAEPAADLWATPPAGVGAQRRPPLGSRIEAASSPVRIRQTDPLLMVGGVLAAAAGAVTYSSLSAPWAHARISDASASTNLVAEMTFRGSDSIAGRVGLVLAIALGLLGLLWFWYGLDGGVRVPAIAHPASALIAACVAGVLVAFAGIGYFFWNDAFVGYARDAGMTRRAMRDLLDAQPSPTITVERLGGVLRFGAAAGLAALAGVVAWWSQPRRS